MHNRRNKKIDKPQDFFGTIKKIIKYNKPFLVLIILALFLSFLSSILSIIGPDKLKDITNTIQTGLLTGIDLEKVKNIGIISFLLIILIPKSIFILKATITAVEL